MAPDPLKDGMMAISIKHNVRPGQWFYFSTMPDFIFLWNGSNIESAYDRKHNQWRYYAPGGTELRGA